MMMKLREDENWLVTKNKKLRHPNNKSFVTARVNMINRKKVIRFSIGIDVCDLIDFKKNDRVNVFIHKNDRNLLIIKKDYEIDSDGYQLNHSQPNKSFMSFDIRYESSESFKLSQTIILDYDFNEIGMLLINLEKIKWSK